jgi:hypothetical protein
LYTTACPHSYVYCPLNITCLFSVIQQWMWNFASIVGKVLEALLG